MKAPLDTFLRAGGHGSWHSLLWIKSGDKHELLLQGLDGEERREGGTGNR